MEQLLRHSYSKIAVYSKNNKVHQSCVHRIWWIFFEAIWSGNSKFIGNGQTLYVKYSHISQLVFIRILLPDSNLDYMYISQLQNVLGSLFHFTVVSFCSEFNYWFLLLKDNYCTTREITLDIKKLYKHIDPKTKRT